jgi:ERF superfamily
MQRSSESIGAIASALAKAQSELINPEKSLIATIRSPFPRDGDRTFRYASLSSGLDIVRKTLGKHEIATVQITAIDKDAGLIRLTTVSLRIHPGSGSRLTGRCVPVGETAAPHKMGAALTYARRYALFTLVGIAGQDDLDAPDLPVTTTDPGSPGTKPPEKMNGHGGETTSGKPEWPRKPQSPKPILDAQASRVVRDRLCGEIALGSGRGSHRMGEPQDRRQKHSDGGGCRRRRSRLWGADAGAAARSLFLDLDRIRSAEPPQVRKTKPVKSQNNLSRRGWQVEAGARIKRPLCGSGLKAAVPPRSPGATATKIICASFLASRARFAADSRARAITFGLPSQALSAAGYRTSSQFRCAAFIIASSTASAMSAHGGSNSI